MPNAELREHGEESVQLLPEPDGEAYKVFVEIGAFEIIDINDESVTYLDGIFISFGFIEKTIWNSNNIVNDLGVIFIF